jgi:hypothetical protein
MTQISHRHFSHAGAPSWVARSPPVPGFDPSFTRSRCLRMVHGRGNFVRDAAITRHSSRLCLSITMHHPQKKLPVLATFNLCFTRPMVFAHRCTHQHVPRHGQVCVRHWKTRWRSRDCKLVLLYMEWVFVLCFA